MAGALFHLTGKPIFPIISQSNPSRLLSLYHRPTTINMAQTQPYWASIEADIEIHLKKSIPIRPPMSVFEPMHYLTFAAPETKGPALCIAACELVGGDRDQAIVAASALYLMQAATYTHENLPLTDRARPKPVIHHAYNPNIELLTGDGIVPFGLELLARSVDPTCNNSDRILRIIIEITRAVGSQGVVVGQYKEFLLSQLDSEKSWDTGDIEYICRKKEGGIYACGAACGAILGGGSEEEIENLRKYGLYVGMIEGMLYGVGRNNKGMEKVVEKLGVLALKELEIFKGRKVEPISSLVEANLCNV